MVAIHLQSPLLPEEPPPPPQAPLPPPEPKEAIPLDEPEPEPLEPLPELPVVEVSLPTKREHAPLRRNVRLPKPLLSPVREMPQSLPPPVVRKRPAPPAPVGTTTPPRRIVERSPLVRYPSLARRMGMEGRVVLLIRVTLAGEVEAIEIAESSGHSLLDRAALDCVRDWIFLPGRRNGEPVATSVRIPVEFELR
jgi:protein TonB